MRVFVILRGESVHKDRKKDKAFSSSERVAASESRSTRKRLIDYPSFIHTKTYHPHITGNRPLEENIEP